jgi:hypothetical protein
MPCTCRAILAERAVAKAATRWIWRQRAVPSTFGQA